MKELRLKLEQEAARVQFSKNVGFPTKPIIEHIIKKAKEDTCYYNIVKEDDLADTLIYLAEYFIAHIVKSKESFISDELTYEALDAWILDKDGRSTKLEEVAKEVHPQSKTRNPFFDTQFLSKSNLEKMSEGFKALPAMAHLIKKYYKEPAVVKTSTKIPTPIPKKPKDDQLSLDMLLAGDNEETKVGKEISETQVEETVSSNTEEAIDTTDVKETSELTAAEPEKAEVSPEPEKILNEEVVVEETASIKETEKLQMQPSKSSAKQPKNTLNGQIDLFSLL